MITPAVLWTKQFWINLVEGAVGAGITGFLGSLAATGAALNLHNLETALWAGAAGAIAIVLHSFGVTSQVNATAKAEASNAGGG